METKDKKSEFKEKRDLIIQAGIEAIPYIGGTLSTLYFGNKQEIRFKRIEEFYAKVADDVRQMKERIDLSDFDSQKLNDFIETVHENVEKEIISEKIEFFKNCFLRSLTEMEFKYEIRKLFIRCLGALDENEIFLLKEFNKHPEGQFLSVKQEGVTNKERFEAVASFERLKSYGLISSFLSGPLRPNIDWSEITQYKLTDLGKEFIDFCLTSRYA